jgi:membrane protease YdiL (CAAX protease family)
MKSCDYCGKENEDVQNFCIGCGTELPQPVPPIIPSTEPPVIEPPFLPAAEPVTGELNGGTATAVLGIYLGVQFAVGIVLAFFGGVLLGLQGEAYHIRDALQPYMPFVVLADFLFCGVALFWSANAFKFQLNDTSPTGAAWVRGSWGDIAKGLGTGILISILTMLVMSRFEFHNYRHQEPSPLIRMSMTPGFPQIVWVITAVLFAPPIEELLFRGIVYGGYRKSLGAAAAATLTTFIFVMLHFEQFIRQPVAIFGITGLALAALWQRLRSRAIGPAVATHFGYNAVVSAIILYHYH